MKAKVFGIPVMGPFGQPGYSWCVVTDDYNGVFLKWRNAVIVALGRSGLSTKGVARWKV